MKISAQTIEVLKHLATINPALIVEKGSTLRSKAIAGNMAAEAVLSDNFDQGFAIGNVAQFIRTVGFFSDPELVFAEDHVLVKGADGTESHYYFTDPKLIEQNNKPVKMPDADVTFTITREALARFFKAAGGLALSDITIKNEGKRILMVASDRKNDKSNTYRIEVGDYEGSGDFSAVFKRDNFKLTDNAFEVKLCKKGIAQFRALDSEIPELAFWIAIEVSDSTFA